MKEKIANYRNNLDKKYFDAETKHFEWVDICKGILIIAVVMGHSFAISTPYVYMFHIPLFFFLAGYVERLDQKSMLQIAVQRFLTLFVPYVAVNIIYLVGRIALNVVEMQGYFYDDVLGKERLWEHIVAIVKIQWVTDLGGATWYLACLFITFLLAKIIVILTHNKITIITVLLAAVIGGIGLLFDYLGIYLVYYLDIAMVAVFYLILGNYCKKYRLFDYLTYINWIIWAILFIVYCFVFANKLHAAVDWSARNYNNPLLSMVTILLAAVILMNFCKSIQNTKVGNMLSFYGKESLAFMMVHFVCFKVIVVFLVKLDIYPVTVLKNLVPPNNGIWNFLYLPGAILIFTGIHFLARKLYIYQWFFQGKMPVPQKVRDGFYNKYSADFVIVIAFIFLSNIPFASTVRAVVQLNEPYQIEGMYEDYFLDKQVYISLNKQISDVRIQLHNPFEVENQCEVYVDDINVGTYRIKKKEDAKIEIPISDSGKHTIKLEFENVFIPKELGWSEDIRPLTAVLVDGRIAVD